jgi:membrane fusion protein (multidrug efflux system)
MKKRFIIIGSILFFVFGGLIAYHFISSYFIKKYIKNYAPPPITVNTLTINPVEWNPTYETVGAVQAVQGTEVSPIVSGMVTKILFNSGDIVKKNQVLIILDTDVQQAQVSQARALANYDKQTYERYKTLFHQGVVSAQDLDQSASSYGQALASLHQQEALLEQKYIVAPFAGRVGIRDVSLGQYLNAGTMVTNIQSINPMYINFQVPEQFLTQLYLGQPVRMTIDTFPGVIFKGKISAFDAQVADNTKSITVQATAPNIDKKAMMLPGMQVNIAVILPQKGKVIAIPQQALNYSLYGNTVFVIKPSTDKQGKPDVIASQVAVTPGDQQGNLVEIFSGLNKGDEIVVDGQIKLQNNNPVKVVINSTQS